MRRPLLLSVFLAILVLSLSGCNQTHIQVDNITPLSELQTEEYNQEQFYTIQAIFNVQRSFHKVSAQYLCDYEGITLDFKRSIAQNDYYVLHHGQTVRCYIFTDEEDNVREVLVMRDIPSIQEAMECKEEQQAFGFPFPPSQYATLSLNLTSALEIDRQVVQYFLRDGILLAETHNLGQDTETTKFTFYTDEEWAQLAIDYGGYVILPMDKT